MSNIVQEMQKSIKEWAERKGWNVYRTFGDEIALAHTELSEAFEAFREAGDCRIWYELLPLDRGSLISDDLSILHEKAAKSYGGMRDVATDVLSESEWNRLACAGLAKPCGVPSELADTVIRILHTSSNIGVDFWSVLEQKMVYNETRSFRHGGKAI